MSYQALWARYFLLTTAIELAVAVPLLRRAEPSPGRRAAAVVLANLASHPVVWFVLARVIESRDVLTPVAEAWAVGCEAAVYALVFRGLGPARAVGISAVANATSFLVGVALSRLSP